jgi:hypothetical protein
VSFLPNSRKFTFDKTTGKLSVKQFNDLLLELKNIHKEYRISTNVINDIFVYKDILLNPLSHDNLSSAVYKDEITSVLSIVPYLQKLKSTLLKEVQSGNSTIKFKDIDTTTHNQVEYLIFLKENLWFYTLLDGNNYLSNSGVVALKRIENGTTTDLGNDYKDIHACVKRLSHFLGTNYASDDQILTKLDFS